MPTTMIRHTITVNDTPVTLVCEHCPGTHPAYVHRDLPRATEPVGMVRNTYDTYQEALDAWPAFVAMWHPTPVEPQPIDGPADALDTLRSLFHAKETVVAWMRAEGYCRYADAIEQAVQEGTP